MIKVASEASQVLIAKVYEAKQEHLLDWWEDLNASEQEVLLASIKEIDFQLLQRLSNRYLKGSICRNMGICKPQPATPKALPRTADEWEEWRQLKALGEKTLAEGRVAVFMAAGLNGTDIGLSGPEGLCPVGPISQKTLLQYQCEKIVALKNKREYKNKAKT